MHTHIMCIYSIQISLARIGYILDNAFLERYIPERCVLSPTNASQTTEKELRCMRSAHGCTIMIHAGQLVANAYLTTAHLFYCLADLYLKPPA
jgi:hypothetical protein